MNQLLRTRSSAPFTAVRRVRSGEPAAWWNDRSFVIIAMLLSTLPLLGPTIPPLLDLPGHLGRYQVMLGTDAATLGQWYQFRWHLVANLGVDALVFLLAPLLGLELAVKLIVITIPPLTIGGMLWIAREVHGRIPATAIYALPLAYNFPFHFGFLNFSLSMALALNAFAAWMALDRWGRHRLRAAIFVPLAAAIWLCHLVGWGVLCVLVGAAELVVARRRVGSWRHAVLPAGLACVPLALPLLMQMMWRSGMGGGLTAGNWFRLDFKASWLAMVLRDRWMWFDVPCTAVLYLLLYKGWRDSRFGFSRDLCIAAGLMLAVFLGMPAIVYGSAYADMRLAPFVVMLGLLALRPMASVSARELSLLAIGGLLLFGVRLIGTGISFDLYDQRYRRELAALNYIPHGARLATLVGRTCDDAWAKTRIEHLPALAMVRRSAFSNDQWPLAGAPLLTVISPAGATFANDPSQQVVARPCESDPDVRTIAAALRVLPRDSFDYLWLIAPPPFDSRRLTDMTRLWSSGDSAVFRINHHAASTTTVAEIAPAS